jgi:septal ring-binding cell division protein DamX
VRITTGVVLWLAAAVAATVVGLFAVGGIGDDIFGTDASEPLSQSEVDRRLAEATSSAAPPSAPSSGPSSPSSTPSAPATRPPANTPPAAKPTSVPSAGGTVIARCASDGVLVQVLGSTPAQGYQVEPEHDDLDDHPKITFTSGRTEIEVRLRCVGGRISPEIRNKN